MLRAHLETRQYKAVCLDKNPARRCFPGDSVSRPYLKQEPAPQSIRGVAYWVTGSLVTRWEGAFLWKERPWGMPAIQAASHMSRVQLGCPEVLPLLALRRYPHHLSFACQFHGTARTHALPVLLLDSTHD